MDVTPLVDTYCSGQNPNVVLGTCKLGSPANAASLCAIRLYICILVVVVVSPNALGFPTATESIYMNPTA